MKFLKGKFCQLRQITEEDLPLLLEWRNAKHVNENMEYQATISWEQHQKWFQDISEKGFYYFLIETIEKEPFGTIYVSNINDKNTAECGLYIGNSKFIGTGITIEASKLLIDFAFQELNISYLHAKVKATNQVIIDYNKLLGFEEKERINVDFLLMQLKNQN